MNKSISKDEKQPMVGFTVHVPFTLQKTLKEAAYRDRTSVSKWVADAINAKLEANGK